MSAIAARLFILFQWIVPQHVVTAIVFRMARIRNVSIKNFFIRQFVSAFKVDIDEVSAPVPDGFANFNEFFTRELVAGARSVDGDANTITSPVDGTVSAAREQMRTRGRLL